jgi:hypothetical protein
MPPEPAIKRGVAFVDGQNLFFAARQAFGYTYPNYDFPSLAAAVCAANGWQLDQARFYTGLPAHPMIRFGTTSGAASSGI